MAPICERRFVAGNKMSKQWRRRAAGSCVLPNSWTTSHDCGADDLTAYSHRKFSNHLTKKQNDRRAQGILFGRESARAKNSHTVANAKLSAQTAHQTPEVVFSSKIQRCHDDELYREEKQLQFGTKETNLIRLYEYKPEDQKATKKSRLIWYPNEQPNISSTQ
jgi:hypothetical protein